MTIALEPMLLVGTNMTRVMPDEWTVVSMDGSLTAHFEHSVAITDEGPVILTLLENGSGAGQIHGQNMKEAV
jgi:methionyl aminopeptidase